MPIPQTDNTDVVIALYADGPSQLEAAIAGLSETSFDVSSNPESWTIRQIVHHVVDGDDLWKMHVKAALGNSDGVFSMLWYWGIPQDEWVENWHYAGRAIEPSLALFRANRGHIVQLMQQVPDAWERFIFLQLPNGEKVRRTVGYTIEQQATHVVEHINEILAIRQTHQL
jgi:hypothetical protein